MTQIFMHSASFGANDNDDPLDSVLRIIATAANKDPREWADKYGVEYENETFKMQPFCWCEREECPYCWDFTDYDTDERRTPPQELKDKYGMEDERSAPNFWYKPTNFKVWWYKYIGRGVETSENISLNEIVEMANNCLKSIKPA